MQGGDVKDLDGEDTSLPVLNLTEEQAEIVALRWKVQELQQEVDRLRQEASDRSWLDSK